MSENHYFGKKDQANRKDGNQLIDKLSPYHKLVLSINQYLLFIYFLANNIFEL